MPSVLCPPPERTLALRRSVSCAFFMTVAHLLLAPSAVRAEATTAEGTPACAAGQVCAGEKTPVVTGFFLGIDAGYTWVDTGPARRVSIGRGVPFVGRISLEFWDQAVIGLSVGAQLFKDLAPTSEQVVDCQRVNGVVVDCDDEPHAQQSGVHGPLMMFEGGWQPQIRLSRATLLAPGPVFGYLHTFGGIRREVACDGCPKGDRLDFDASGPYLGGSLQFSLVRSMGFAVALRSLWFFASDLHQMTTLGFGFFAHEDTP
ncbi:MAG: hypothetical protein QM778_12115 [Myxococcales bacterium]